MGLLNRRQMLAASLALLPAAAWAGPRRVAFAVLRSGQKIGEHQVSFAADGPGLTATSEVEMLVRLGPVPVFRYRHQAVERWTGARFEGLEAHSVTNGKTQNVTTRRSETGLVLEGPHGRVLAPAAAVPLTHWNPEIFAHPLFNPQEGKMLKVQASRAGPGHWSLRGEAEIDDFYSEAGVWSALKGKLKDGSMLEYKAV